MTAPLLALYLLLLSALLFAGAKAPKVQQPRATLIASRRAGMAPLKVDFTLLVKDPEKLVRCPSEVSWAWALDGEKRGYARAISDCDPFRPLGDVPTSWTERRTLLLRQPGEWMVAACLRGMGGLTVCGLTTLDIR